VHVKYTTEFLVGGFVLFFTVCKKKKHFTMFKKVALLLFLRNKDGINLSIS